MRLFYDKATGCYLDWRLRQRMAPSMCRMIEYMEQHPELISAPSLAEKIHACRYLVTDYLKELEKSKIVGVAEYRVLSSTGYGSSTPLYKIGVTSVAKPKPKTRKAMARERRQKLKKAFGSKTAKEIIRSCAHVSSSRIVKHGFVLFEDGKINHDQVKLYLEK